MGITSLQQLLNYVPGFQSSRDVEQGTAHRITARGRSTALSESVLILINGDKINDLYTGGVSIINRMISLYNIKRIEIIRGPGSALYGGNAFLGVINIVTHNDENSVTFSTGSLNTNRASLLYSNNDNSLNLHANYVNDKGDDVLFTDLYGQQSITRDPIESKDVHINYQQNNWQIVARYMEQNLDDFLPLGTIGDGISSENTHQWSVTGSADFDISSNISMTAKLHHSKDKWQANALLIPKDIEIAPEFSLSKNFVGGPFLRSSNNKLNFDGVYQFSSSTRWSFGLAYEEAKIDDVYTLTTHNLATLEPYPTVTKLFGKESFNETKSRTITSFYLQNQMLLSEHWEITAGLRSDNYNDFGHALAPRMALVWKPATKRSVKLMYGSAFRAPNFLELYDKNNYVDFGNRNLQEENVETLELAFVQTAENYHAELTLFNNNFNDLIQLSDPVEDVNNPFFAPSFTNVDQVKSRGAELDLNFRITSEFSVSGNYTWFTQSSAINVPRQLATVIVNYQLGAWHINSHSYYRGINRSIANQSSYWVHGINVRYQYNNKTTIALHGENIFDQNYKTQSILYAEGLPNRGSVVNLSIEYQF